jgi:hypothetical protein
MAGVERPPSRVQRVEFVAAGIRTQRSLARRRECSLRPRSHRPTRPISPTALKKASSGLLHLFADGQGTRSQSESRLDSQHLPRGFETGCRVLSATQDRAVGCKGYFFPGDSITGNSGRDLYPGRDADESFCNYQKPLWGQSDRGQGRIQGSRPSTHRATQKSPSPYCSSGYWASWGSNSQGTHESKAKAETGLTYHICDSIPQKLSRRFRTENSTPIADASFVSTFRAFRPASDSLPTFYWAPRWG